MGLGGIRLLFGVVFDVGYWCVWVCNGWWWVVGIVGFGVVKYFE